MYRKILVPLDGSQMAECALGHVKEIAKGCGSASVDLMRAVEIFPNRAAGYGMGYAYPYVDPYIDPKVFDEIEKSETLVAKDYLSKIEEDLKESGIKVKSVVLRGGPATAILEYSEKNNIDLIVMTTNGRSGVTRWALGSVAERVTKHSTIPVLIITPAGCRVSK